MQYTLYSQDLYQVHPVTTRLILGTPWLCEIDTRYTQYPRDWYAVHPVSARFISSTPCNHEIDIRYTLTVRDWYAVQPVSERLICGTPCMGVIRNSSHTYYTLIAVLPPNWPALDLIQWYSDRQGANNTGLNLFILSTLKNWSECTILDELKLQYAGDCYSTIVWSLMNF
jgi:hypothetical protein